VNDTNASVFLGPGIYTPVMPPKVDRVLADVRTWCDQHNVARAELARMIGVQRSAVTDWYAHRKTPTAEQVLTMLEILSKR
jgi:DNA-binding transcriptional regulator YiaG